QLDYARDVRVREAERLARRAQEGADALGLRHTRRTIVARVVHTPQHSVRSIAVVAASLHLRFGRIRELARELVLECDLVVLVAEATLDADAEPQARGGRRRARIDACDVEARAVELLAVVEDLREIERGHRAARVRLERAPEVV